MKALKKSHVVWTMIIPAIILTGCLDNATDPHDEDGPLTAELTISPDHVHTLSEINYTVKVTDQNGNIVADLETIEVQRKVHGESEWRGTELELSGNEYTGSYTFMSSGEYDIRVAGLRHGSDQMEVMYEMGEHFNVGRAHVNAENYRIEYEHFPGHMHEGDNADIKFWVFEKDEDVSGVRPPVSGLENIHIHCGNPDGTEEHHTSVEEAETGVYVTGHTFMGAGEAHMKIHFPGEGGTEIEAEFTFEVAHGH